MAPLSVPRAVDAGRGLPRRRPRARRRPPARREGDAHARDAPPRERARLPRVRGAVPGASHRGAAAAALRARRGDRLRGGRRTDRRARERAAPLAPGAARAPRPTEARAREPPPVARLVRARSTRGPRLRAVVERLALAHGGRDVRARTELARSRRGRRGARGGASRAALPRRVRPREPRRPRAVDGIAARRPRAGARAARASPLRRRSRANAPRPPARAAPRRECSRPGPLPAALGQRPARPRPPHARAPRGVPEGRDREERRRRRDVPRRRLRRRDLDARERPRSPAAVRAAAARELDASSRTRRDGSRRSWQPPGTHDLAVARARRAPGRPRVHAALDGPRPGPESRARDRRRRSRGGNHRLRHGARVRRRRVGARPQRAAARPRAPARRRRASGARRDEGRHGAPGRCVAARRPREGHLRGLRGKPRRARRACDRPLPPPCAGPQDALADLDSSSREARRRRSRRLASESRT